MWVDDDDPDMPKETSNEFDWLATSTVPTILSEKASDHGDNSFLIYGETGEEISFKEMNKKSNIIGNSLREIGLEKGDKVSILCKTPPRVFETLFGVVKGGGVFSPINYEYFGRELIYNIKDTNPKFLIAEDIFVERLNKILPELDDLPHIILMETGHSDGELDGSFQSTYYKTLLKGNESVPAVNIDWSDEAFIKYTSGTTGDPKGCVISHRMALANWTYPLAQLFTEEDVWHNMLPTYHFGGLVPAFVAMVSGGKSTLWDRFSPDEFWDRVDEYDATMALILSVMIDWLQDQPEREDDWENTLKMARLQPLPDDHQEFAERFGIDFLYQGFAQTETGLPLTGYIHAAKNEKGTPESLIRGLTPEEFIKRANEYNIPVVEQVPGESWIGQPYNVEATILNEKDEIVPPGESGHFAIRPNRPSMILDGYFGKPEATVDAMSNFWFHTGDIATRDENGNFFFIDRDRNIIRRRGENISPVQIERPLRDLKGIDQIAVFPVPAQEGGEDEPVVVIQPESGATITEDQIQDHLEGELPEYLHPKYIDFWEELPLTPTNKVQVGEIMKEFKEEHPEFN